jgi:DNA repair exonuclease SbcCD ATPase subunit
VKLRSLEVVDFRRIRRAKVELGAGLNVIYGPNDLGKSTLVEALRAALLLPSTSAHANAFAPWDRDAVPAVSLELEHGGVLYAVKKTWGSGTRATSTLERSDDGNTFAVDARQREVDGKLRELFQWGIASPGGKQAPKGLPESFLTSVLFGTQAESDALFGASLEKDSDEAGRLRLTDALEAYAQDPVFKEILERAQAKVEEAFSTTGKKRGGKASPFREPGEAVKEAKRLLDHAQEQLEKARRTQEEAERLREAFVRATEAREQAHADRERAERDAEATTRRVAARRALDEARASLTAFETERERRRALESRICEAETKLRDASARLSEAEANAKLAREAFERARETLRDVRGREAERELRAQELGAERKELRARLEAREARRRRADEAERAKDRAEASARAVDEARGRARDAERALEEARAAVARMDAAAKLAERRELARRVEELAARARELDAVQTRIAAREAELARHGEDGPTRATLDALRALASSLAVAEAKLEVGLSLALRRLGDATVEASADGEHVSAEGKTLALDARRELRVKIAHQGAPLVELVVTGGAADARADVEAARARFAEAVVAHGIDPNAPIETAIGELAARVDAASARREARLELERGLRDDRESLARLRTVRAEHDALAARLAALPVDELSEELRRHAEALLIDLGDDAEREIGGRRDEARTLERRALERAEVARRELAERSSRAEVDAAEAALKAESVGPDVESSATEDDATLRARVAGLDAELEALTSATDAREAEERVRRAREALDASELAVGTTREAQQHQARTVAADRARLEELTLALARTDGEKLAEDVRAREAALAALPEPTREVDEDALRHARFAAEEADRLATEARERHLLFVGQLEASEGSVAIERHREAEEAHALALAREHEVEVDFGAWKLLRDALRDAENAEGHHLGEALAPKVAARLAELATQTRAPARYAGVRLDAHLRTEGVLAQGQTRDPKLLSVGTREQLALLLRLAVAELLKLPLVLDDHLTHTDPARASWFRQTLRAAAHDTQIVVLTCHPDVYLDDSDRPKERAFQDRAAGLLRAIDATRVIES